MALDPASEYLALVDHKRHKLVKFIDQKSKMKAQKIYTFINIDERKIQLYREHFENVKDWHKRRFFGTSVLNTIGQYEIEEIKPKEYDGDKNLYFKVNRRYMQFLNFEEYLNRTEQKKIKSLPDTLDQHIYMFQQFLAAIWRGGGINNFFYTPKNVFVVYNYSLPQENKDFEQVNLVVNNLSSVGLELLFLNGGSILKQDLIEIYPLLPPNLYNLMKDAKTYKREVNRLIKMRAFGWLIFSYIIKNVKNVLLPQTSLQVVIDAEKVNDLLSKSQGYFKSLLSVYKFVQKIKQVQSTTGIKILSILQQIFLKNCKNLSWNGIYIQFFITNKRNQIIYQQKYKNKINQLQKDKLFLDKKKILQQKVKMQRQETERTQRQYMNMSRIVIQDLWKIQKNKDFYLEKCIERQSMLFLLIRINVNFHSILRFTNLMEFIIQQNFSEDLTTFSSGLMSQFNLTPPKSKSQENDYEQQSTALSKQNCLNFSNFPEIKSPFKYNQHGVMFLAEPQVPYMIILKNFTNIVKGKGQKTQGQKNNQYNVYVPHRNNQILHSLFNSFV